MKRVPHQGNAQEMIAHFKYWEYCQIECVLIDDNGNYINPSRLSWLKRILLRFKYYKGIEHGNLETMESLKDLGFRKWDKVMITSTEAVESSINEAYNVY